MANPKPSHNTSLVGIAGKSNERLHVLANLFYEPLDPEAMTSVVVSLRHKPDVRWKTLYSVNEWCTSVDESEAGALFVASMEGTVHHFSEGRWDVIDSQCPAGLNAVWACGDREAFAAGVGGERVRISGSHVAVVRDPARRRLNAIHGRCSSAVFAVGDGGLVYRYDGSRWHEIESPTSVNLLSVCCVSENEVYIGGAEGVVLRWDGSMFDVFLVGDVTISSITLFDGLVCLASGTGGVYALDGERSFLVKDVPLRRVRAIDSRLFGVGDRMVAQFDGAAWWGGNLDL